MTSTKQRVWNYIVGPCLPGVFCGIVISAGRNNKTATIAVTHRLFHPKYKVYFNRVNRYHLHDEFNECSLGDKVQARQSRRFSKIKSWVLDKIIHKEPGAAILQKYPELTPRGKRPLNPLPELKMR